MRERIVPFRFSTSRTQPTCLVPLAHDTETKRHTPKEAKSSMNLDVMMMMLITLLMMMIPTKKREWSVLTCSWLSGVAFLLCYGTVQAVDRTGQTNLRQAIFVGNSTARHGTAHTSDTTKTVFVSRPKRASRSFVRSFDRACPSAWENGRVKRIRRPYSTRDRSVHRDRGGKFRRPKVVLVLYVCDLLSHAGPSPNHRFVVRPACVCACSPGEDRSTSKHNQLNSRQVSVPARRSKRQVVLLVQARQSMKSPLLAR